VSKIKSLKITKLRGELFWKIIYRKNMVKIKRIKTVTKRAMSKPLLIKSTPLQAIRLLRKSPAHFSQLKALMHKLGRKQAKCRSTTSL
jgi:hypothetical protein